MPENHTCGAATETTPAQRHALDRMVRAMRGLDIRDAILVMANVMCRAALFACIDKATLLGMMGCVYDGWIADQTGRRGGDA